MDTLPTDQHHPFADLDVHHDSHTDAEEALEAIRVAIGQTNDFDTDHHLHDHHVETHSHELDTTLHLNDEQHHQATAQDTDTSLHQQLGNGQESNSIDPTLANQTEEPTPTLSSAVQIQSAVFEKGLKAIIDLGFSNEVLLDSIKNQEHADTVKTIVEDVKRKSEIAKELLSEVQSHASDCTCYPLFDPSTIPLLLSPSPPPRVS